MRELSPLGVGGVGPPTEGAQPTYCGRRRKKSDSDCLRAVVSTREVRSGRLGRTAPGTKELPTGPPAQVEGRSVKNHLRLCVYVNAALPRS